MLVILRGESVIGHEVLWACVPLSIRDAFRDAVVVEDEGEGEVLEDLVVYHIPDL